MIAADTSTWIAFLEGSGGADTLLLDQALGDHQVLMAPVVLTELLSDPKLPARVSEMPQQVEANITDTFERFFTLGSNIDHIESRSLTGVSLIKVYFQPGTDPDAAVSEIANLAMADLRRLPQGTLPPVVLKFDASSLPVCLVTLKGEGLDETRLKD